MNIRHSLTTAVCAFFLCVLTSCGAEEKNVADEPLPPVLDCPFTDIGWEAAPEDVIAAEGSDFTTYHSVYGGTCYTWPKDFNGRSGTIKYMFDDKDRLMCAAWAYGSESVDELHELYRTIHMAVNEQYGESGYNADRPDNYGDVWYLESGDIVLSTMVTSDTKALQYAYLHPLVSNAQSASGQQ